MATTKQRNTHRSVGHEMRALNEHELRFLRMQVRWLLGLRQSKPYGVGVRGLSSQQQDELCAIARTFVTQDY